MKPWTGYQMVQFFLICETKTSRDVHTVTWRISATASDELTEFDEHVTDTTVWQSRNDTPVIWPASQVDISSSDCDFLYRIRRTRTSAVAAMKYSDIKPTLYRSTSLLSRYRMPSSAERCNGSVWPYVPFRNNLRVR